MSRGETVPCPSCRQPVRVEAEMEPLVAMIVGGGAFVVLTVAVAIGSAASNLWVGLGAGAVGATLGALLLRRI